MWDVFGIHRPERHAEVLFVMSPGFGTIYNLEPAPSGTNRSSYILEEH